MSTYVFCRTPYSFTHCRETSKNRAPSKIQHGDNIYSMPNGFMLSIDTRERKNICLSSKEKITNIIAVVICIQLQLQDEWKQVSGDVVDLVFYFTEININRLFAVLSKI